VIARRVWSGWRQALLVVTPETVVRWHRAGFRMYWRLISRVQKQVERKQTTKDIRELIFQNAYEYIRAPHAHKGSCLPKASRCVEARMVFRPSLPRKVPIWSRLMSWRSRAVLTAGHEKPESRLGVAVVRLQRSPNDFYTTAVDTRSTDCSAKSVKASFVSFPAFQKGSPAAAAMD
jgi:hypothetical protein